MDTRKLTTTALDAGKPLATWLAWRLGIRREEAVRRCAGGAVDVDGAPVRDGERVLRAGQRVVVRLPLAAVPEDWRVVAVHPGIVVVDKPVGLPVTGAGGRTLELEVAARFPGATPFHDVEREMSGLVLFTTAPEARRHLAAALAERKFLRGHAAVVEGGFSGPLLLEETLEPDPADPRRLRPTTDGTLARARVSVRATGRRALLSVELELGGTQHIRALLAGAAWPILGDRLYRGAKCPRLALHGDWLAWPGGDASSAVPPDLVELLA